MAQRGTRPWREGRSQVILSDETNGEAHASGRHTLIAKRLGIIPPERRAAVFMRTDCSVCRSEGFASRAQVLVQANDRETLASLYHLSDGLLGHGEIGLSEQAWDFLGAREGQEIVVRHAPPIGSLTHLRKRVYGHRLDTLAYADIINDIVASRYSDVHLSAFVTACSAFPLDIPETVALTEAMIGAGDRLTWPGPMIVDKHSVGGLPGNRTTPIVVSILAAEGLVMPKTSSRAITSPAGTADTMETLAPVDLDIASIRRVVEEEGGCVVWGGSVRLSPADDIIIGVERVLDLDAVGQLVASVLSKKIAAGSTHLVIDMPVGETAKVRNAEDAHLLSDALLKVSAAFGLTTQILTGDGRQPIGNGIGPALEAMDILAVLQGTDGPPDLAARACELAGALLEMAGKADSGSGVFQARRVLADGRAWQKFQRICEAQGGMRVPPISTHRYDLQADRTGVVQAIDNRRLAMLAKLAGAPAAKAAGVQLQAKLGSVVKAGTPLCTVHAESRGELDYAVAFAASNPGIFRVIAE